MRTGAPSHPADIRSRRDRYSTGHQAEIALSATLTRSSHHAKTCPASTVRSCSPPRARSIVLNRLHLPQTEARMEECRLSWPPSGTVDEITIMSWEVRDRNSISLKGALSADSNTASSQHRVWVEASARAAGRGKAARRGKRHPRPGRVGDGHAGMCARRRSRERSGFRIGSARLQGPRVSSAPRMWRTRTIDRMRARHAHNGSTSCADLSASTTSAARGGSAYAVSGSGDRGTPAFRPEASRRHPRYEFTPL